MLRITNLLRAKQLKKVPLRAGLPGWDRPDPPASAHVQINHELTDEEIVFTFFDTNMPEFFLTQPEVYEGDTLLEAAPMFVKGFGSFIGAALFLGSILYFTFPLRQDAIYREQVIDRYTREEQAVQSKQWLKWGRKNPLGIDLSSEYFPQTKMGQTDIGENFKNIKAEIDAYVNVNKQTKGYFQKIKEVCEKRVQERLANPEANDHHH